MNDIDTAARDSAYYLLSLGRPEEALRKLADDFDPDDPWSWHVRAAALLALDRHDEAIDAAEEGLALDPENAILFDALAAARLARGDYAEAEEAILAALSIDAEDADFLTRYAHIVARVGQIEKAEKLVARALSVDPENEFALQMHALLATARDDRKAIMDRTRELLRHVPESSLAHRLLGAAHSDRGSVDDAADHFARAARLDPSDGIVVEAAREARLRSHWLLWPLRPIQRFGPAPVWVTAVVIMLVLRTLKLHNVLIPFAIFWLVYCVYTWVAPPLARKLLR